MVDFSKLKANKAQNTKAAVEALTAAKNQNDDNRFWKPTLDKEKGTGGAVIRFIPAKEDRTLGYVTYFEHAFDGPTKKWYIERSLSSIGGKDSIASLNSRLWATNQEVNKNIARKQKRQTRYVSNILVINDPAKPENNGKTFLYRFGPKIFSFIEKALQPKPHPITGKLAPVLDAFDMWEGAEFELIVNDTKDGWNYDDSKFDVVSPLASNDSLIEAIYNQSLPLAEFEDAKNYKSNADLDKRLIEVLGLTQAGLEVIEGYGVANASQYATGTSAPQQTASPAGFVAGAMTSSVASATTVPDLPFEPDAQTTSFGSSEDEAFFNDLMADATK